MSAEISERGGALIEAFRAAVKSVSYEQECGSLDSIGVALGERAAAHNALVKYVAALESIADAARFTCESESEGDAIDRVEGPLSAALAALGAGGST